MQRLREFYGVAVTADMHVKDRRGCAEQVIVNGRDFYALVDQPFHHRADLVLGQHQITHKHGAIPHGKKADPRAQRKRGFDRNSVHRDFKVSPRQPVLVDSSRLTGARFAHRLINLTPVDLGSARPTGKGNTGDAYNEGHDAMHGSSLLKV